MSYSLDKYLKILELPENASLEEVKKSYRKLTIKYHPDRNKATDAASKFIEITEAYDALVIYFEDSEVVESEEPIINEPETYVYRPQRRHYRPKAADLSEHETKLLDYTEKIMKAMMQLILIGVIFFFLAVLLHGGNLFGLLFFVVMVVLLLLPLQMLDVITIHSKSAKIITILKAFIKSPIGIIMGINFCAMYALCEIGLLTFIPKVYYLYIYLIGTILSYKVIYYFYKNNHPLKSKTIIFSLSPSVIIFVLVLNYFIPSESMIILSSTSNKIFIEEDFPFINPSNYNAPLEKINMKDNEKYWGMDMFDQTSDNIDSIVYNYKEGFLKIPCVHIYGYRNPNKELLDAASGYNR